jgi:DNA-binding Xre family transcriptional regulator
MKKTDLIKVADISTTTLAKLSKNQYVSMEVMGRICKAFSCDIGDVMEMLSEEKTGEEGDANMPKELPYTSSIKDMPLMFSDMNFKKSENCHRKEESYHAN